MIIPPFLNFKWVNNDGSLTPETQIYEDQLNQAMQNSLSDNGWTLPQQTTANITTIATDMPDGTMFYDTDTNEFKIIVNGVVRVVQLV